MPWTLVFSRASFQFCEFRFSRGIQPAPRNGSADASPTGTPSSSQSDGDNSATGHPQTAADEAPQEQDLAQQRGSFSRGHGAQSGTRQHGPTHAHATDHVQTKVIMVVFSCFVHDM